MRHTAKAFIKKMYYLSDMREETKHRERNLPSTGSEYSGHLELYFVCFKGRITKREINRDLLPTGLLSRWLQWPGLARPSQRQEPAALAGSPTRCRAPSTRVIRHCFPRCNRRELNQKWPHQDSNWCPCGWQYYRWRLNLSDHRPQQFLYFFG